MDVKDQEESVRLWIAELEKERGVGPPGDRSTCPETGGVYQEILWHFSARKFPGDTCLRYIYSDRFQEPRESGPYFPIKFETTVLAWKMWRVAFENYLASRNGKICWRVRPELIESESQPGRYYIYSRVFVPDGRA
jgi:hypothetical protein